MTTSPVELTRVEQALRYLEFADLWIEFTPGRRPVYVTEGFQGEVAE